MHASEETKRGSTPACDHSRMLKKKQHCCSNRLEERKLLLCHCSWIFFSQTCKEKNLFYYFKNGFLVLFLGHWECCIIVLFVAGSYLGLCSLDVTVTKENTWYGLWLQITRTLVIKFTPQQNPFIYNQCASLLDVKSALIN